MKQMKNLVLLVILMASSTAMAGKSTYFCEQAEENDTFIESYSYTVRTSFAKVELQHIDGRWITCTKGSYGDTAVAECGNNSTYPYTGDTKMYGVKFSCSEI